MQCAFQLEKKLQFSKRDQTLENFCYNNSSYSTGPIKQELAQTNYLVNNASEITVWQQVEWLKT